MIGISRRFRPSPCLITIFASVSQFVLNQTFPVRCCIRVLPGFSFRQSLIHSKLNPTFSITVDFALPSVALLWSFSRTITTSYTIRATISLSAENTSWLRSFPKGASMMVVMLCRSFCVICVEGSAFSRFRFRAGHTDCI